MSRRVNAISEVSENVKRMDELLESYKRQELPKSDYETLQVGVLFFLDERFFWLWLEGPGTMGFNWQQAVLHFCKGRALSQQE